MAIGARIGARIGAVVGASIGGDPLGGLTWTKDATSGMGTPKNLTEWQSVMITAGLAGKTPSLLWLCQEASGNVADSIGSFTGTASGTGISYQNAVSGWTRKSINTTDAGSGAFNNTDAGLPDLSTTSMMFLLYIQILTTPAATRTVATMGTTVCEAELTTNPRLRDQCGANNVDLAFDPTGSVRPCFLLFDRTNSRSVIYSNQGVASPTFGGTPTGKRFRFGAAGANSSGAAYAYIAAWFGANAELTNAQIKTLGNTLGWTMP